MVMLKLQGRLWEQNFIFFLVIYFKELTLILALIFIQ